MGGLSWCQAGSERQRLVVVVLLLLLLAGVWRCSQPNPCPPPLPGPHCLLMQHASVPLLKEMLLALDLARVAGTRADRRAADRLQRRLMHDDLKESGLLPVSHMVFANG